MLQILAAAIAGCAHPATLVDPVFLDKLSVVEARNLDGVQVYVVFTIETPAIEYGSETVAGPASADPRIQRAVHFPTRMATRLEQQSGEWVHVFGTIRVIDYKAAKTVGVELGWSAIRVDYASLAR